MKIVIHYVSISVLVVLIDSQAFCDSVDVWYAQIENDYFDILINWSSVI